MPSIAADICKGENCDAGPIDKHEPAIFLKHLRDPPAAGFFFLHRGDEAKSSVANCANQALLAAVITNDTASGIDAGGERGLRDVATVPNNLQEVVPPRYQ